MASWLPPVSHNLGHEREFSFKSRNSQEFGGCASFNEYVVYIIQQISNLDIW